MPIALLLNIILRRKKLFFPGNPVVHSNDGNNSGRYESVVRIIVTQNAGGGQDVEIESGSISRPPPPPVNPHHKIRMPLR